VELAGALGLSPPTVSEVVAELVKAGLVVEAGFGSSTGGRRPVMLRFNDRAGYIVAVNLGGTKSQLATFTLRGEQIDCINTPLPRAQTAEEAVSIIMNDISALTSRGSIPKEQLCAVGIAVPRGSRSGKRRGYLCAGNRVEACSFRWFAPKRTRVACYSR